MGVNTYVTAIPHLYRRKASNGPTPSRIHAGNAAWIPSLGKDVKEKDHCE